MDPARALFVSGTLLLAISALLGFVQERQRHSPEAFSQWRVVHAGGTAGAVQLLALSATWPRLPAADVWTMTLACGPILTAWAFFIGPTARALGRPRLARIVNLVGAGVALPTYVVLPAILL
jgi:hypothetical protein